MDEDSNYYREMNRFIRLDPAVYDQDFEKDIFRWKAINSLKKQHEDSFTYFLKGPSYGFIVMGLDECSFYILAESHIVQVQTFKSVFDGKFRPELRQAYVDSTAIHANELFICHSTGKSRIDGLVVAGVLECEAELTSSTSLNIILKNLVLKVVSVEYGRECGMRDALYASMDLLSHMKIIREIKLLRRVFEVIGMEKGAYFFGIQQSLEKIMEEVPCKVLVVSENLQENRYICVKRSSREQVVKILTSEQFSEANRSEDLLVVEMMSVLEWLSCVYKKYKCIMMFVSEETMEGRQLSLTFGGIAGYQFSAQLYTNDPPSVQEFTCLMDSDEEQLDVDYSELQQGAHSAFERLACGSTACVAIIRNKELVVAKSGDSRCVISRNCQAYNLPEDYKPDLNITRAIGNLDLKKDGSLPDENQVLTANPDIITVQSVELCEDGDFLVLACDGIWDDMSSKELVDSVLEQLKTGQLVNREGMACGSTACVAIILKCKKLAEANSGDSRCVISRHGQAHNVSEEYMSDLNLIRATGDLDLEKDETVPAENHVLTANPDIITVELCEDTDFLVLACDGIWDGMSSQQVVDFVQEHIKNESKLSAVCKELCDKRLTLASGSEGCDSMTIILVHSKKSPESDPPTSEESSLKQTS